MLNLKTIGYLLTGATGLLTFLASVVEERNQKETIKREVREALAEERRKEEEAS